MFKGTCKLQNNCTATIKAIVTEEKVSAEICHTHYGHDKQLQHTWLPKAKRQQIAALLQQGVSRDKILEDIRENAMNETDEFMRYHLTDKKDVSNIVKSFGLSQVQKHTNDQESVRAWLEEWEASQNNPVLFCKFQGEVAPEDVDLLKEDFMIVLQTPFQKLMAQKFAGKGVCIDATHGTTGYDFPLTTVMVMDEQGEGFPIAWCLSNHEDFTHMCIFFGFLKQNCGKLSPRWVMSDLANQFYNAWVGIMGGNPLRLVCTWHVDKAWQEELRSKVHDTVTAAEIYKMLRTVLQETDKINFQDYLHQLLERLPSLSSEFYEYFKREWSDKTEIWAYCFRLGMGINTNMLVEAFHRVFKYNYLKGKVNKRVDKCVVNLLKYVRDKYFERVIKLTKGKSCHKQRLIQDRHNKSRAMTTEAVEVLDNFRWKVRGQDGGNIYTVSKQVTNCAGSSCQIKCLECNICIHQYVCNCPDCLIQSTICKHIHLFQRFLLLNPPIENGDDFSGLIPDSKCKDENKYKDTEVKLVAEHLKQEAGPPKDIQKLRLRLREKLLVLADNVLTCDNKSSLQELEKQLNSARHLFSSMNKHKPLEHLEVARQFPGNKNIETQLRFHSTKKKRKLPKNIRFSKPTRAEIEEIFSNNKEGKGMYYSMQS